MSGASPPALTLVQKQREYLSIATEFFGRGLAADEQGDYARALELYESGLATVQEGLGLELSDGEAAEAHWVTQKMREHLCNFDDRVRALQVATSAPSWLLLLGLTCLDSLLDMAACRQEGTWVFSRAVVVRRRLAVKQLRPVRDVSIYLRQRETTVEPRQRAAPSVQFAATSPIPRDQRPTIAC